MKSDFLIALTQLAAERHLLSALHRSEEVGVERVEPASHGGITARCADGEGQPDSPEDHGPVPVGCPPNPRVSPPLMAQQIEEFVDRSLLLNDPIRHFNARGTLACASR